MNIYSFLKQKKVIFFLILFSAIAGMFIPNITHAYSLDELSNDVNNALSGAWGSIQSATLQAIGAMGVFILEIARTILYIAKWVFESVCGGELLAKAVTKDSVVIMGWTAVRDFSNMFIVLGFVIIGISFILRLEGYGTYKTLMRLIIIALLINFSLLICGIIIDGTNITMNYFLSGPTQIGAGTVTEPITAAVTDPQITRDIKSSLAGTPDFGKFASIVASASLYAFIAAMLFVIYAALFLFRYVALMCLVILSPLAFVCSVFPVTKPIYDKWLSQFLQWAIVGVPATFFMWLAGTIAVQRDLGAAASPMPKSALGFWVPVAFMYFSYTLTIQISAIGAVGAIGLASGAMGFVAGASGRVAGGLGRLAAGATGVTRAGQALSDKAIGIGESLGLIPRGAKANRIQGRLDAGRKRMANESEDTLVAVAKKGNKAWTAAERENAAAATEILMKKGKGYMLGDKLEGSLAHAKAYGADFGEMKKGDYRTAGFNEKEIERVRKQRGFTRQQAQDFLQRQSLEDSMRTMTPEARRSIDPNLLDASLITSSSFTPEVIKSFTSADDSIIAKFGTRATIANNFTPQLAQPVANEFARQIQDALNANDQRKASQLRERQDEILRMLSR